jgi:hypothetical protein
MSIDITVSLHRIQGEYQERNFDYRLSYEQHPMQADDVLLHKPRITAEDFRLPAGVPAWRTILLDPKAVGRLRARLLRVMGCEAVYDMGYSRRKWLRQAGLVLGLEFPLEEYNQKIVLER